MADSQSKSEALDPSSSLPDPLPLSESVVETLKDIGGTLMREADSCRESGERRKALEEMGISELKKLESCLRETTTTVGQRSKGSTGKSTRGKKEGRSSQHGSQLQRRSRDKEGVETSRYKSVDEWAREDSVTAIDETSVLNNKGGDGGHGTRLKVEVIRLQKQLKAMQAAGEATRQEYSATIQTLRSQLATALAKANVESGKEIMAAKIKAELADSRTLVAENELLSLKERVDALKEKEKEREQKDIPDFEFVLDSCQNLRASLLSLKEETQFSLFDGMSAVEAMNEQVQRKIQAYATDAKVQQQTEVDRMSSELKLSSKTIEGLELELTKARAENDELNKKYQECIDKREVTEKQWYESEDRMVRASLDIDSLREECRVLRAKYNARGSAELLAKHDERELDIFRTMYRSFQRNIDAFGRGIRDFDPSITLPSVEIHGGDMETNLKLEMQGMEKILETGATFFKIAQSTMAESSVREEEADKERKEMKHRIERLQWEVEMHVNEKGMMQRRFDSVNAENSRLLQVNTSHLSKIEELQNSLFEHKKNLDNEKRNRKECTAEKKKLKEKLNDLLKANERIEEERKESDSQKRELEETRHALSESQDSRQLLKNMMDVLKCENESVSTEITAIQSTVEDKDEQITELRDALRQAIDEGKKAITCVEKKEAALVGRFNEITSRIDSCDVSACNLTVNSIVGELFTQLGSLEDELRDLEAKHEKISVTHAGERAELQKRVADVEAENIIEKGRTDEAKFQAETARKSIQDLKLEIVVLQEKGEEKAKVLDKQREELEEYEMRVEDMSAKSDRDDITKGYYHNIIAALKPLFINIENLHASLPSVDGNESSEKSESQLLREFDEKKYTYSRHFDRSYIGLVLAECSSFVKEVGEKIEKLNEALTESQEMCNTKSLEIERLMSIASTSAKDVESLNSNLAKAEENFDAEKEKLMNCERSLAVEKKAMQTRIDNLEKDKILLQSDIEAFNDLLRKETSRAAAAEETANQTRKELESVGQQTGNEILELKACLSKSAESCREIKSEAERSGRQLDEELQKEVQRSRSLQAKVNDLNSMLRKHKQERKEDLASVQVMKSKVESEWSAKQRLNRRIADLSKRLDESRREVAELRDEAETVNKYKTLLEKETEKKLKYMARPSKGNDDELCSSRMKTQEAVNDFSKATIRGLKSSFSKYCSHRMRRRKVRYVAPPRSKLMSRSSPSSKQEEVVSRQDITARNWNTLLAFVTCLFTIKYGNSQCPSLAGDADSAPVSLETQRRIHGTQLRVIQLESAVKELFDSHNEEVRQIKKVAKDRIAELKRQVDMTSSQTKIFSNTGAQTDFKYCAGNEVDKLLSAISSRESKLSHANQQIDGLRRELGELKKEMERCSTKQESTILKLKESQRMLSLEVSQKCKHITELEADIVKYTSEISMGGSRYKKMDEERLLEFEKLRDRMAMLKEDNTRLQKLLRDSEATRKQLSAEYKRMKDDESAQIICVKKSRNAGIQTELDISEIQSLYTRLREGDTALTQMKEQVNIREDDYRAAREHIKLLEAEINELNAKAIQEAALFEKSKTKLHSLNVNANETAQTLAAAKSKIAALEKERELNSQVRRELSEANENIRKSKEFLSDALEREGEEGARTRSIVEVSRHVSNYVLQRFRDFEKSTIRFHDNEAHTRIQIEHYNEKVLKLEADLERERARTSESADGTVLNVQVAAKLGSMGHEIRSLKERLSRRDREIRELNHMLKSWEAMRESKDLQIAQLMEKCRRFEKDSHNNTRLIDRLQCQLSDMTLTPSRSSSKTCASSVSSVRIKKSPVLGVMDGKENNSNSPTSGTWVARSPPKQSPLSMTRSPIIGKRFSMSARAALAELNTP